MTTSQIESTIKRILIEELQVEAELLENADAETPLLGRGIGLDSIEALRLGLALENEFDLSIPDADLTQDLFSSLGALTNYFERRLSERAPLARGVAALAGDSPFAQADSPL